LRNAPWPAALLALLIYAAWFLAPGVVARLRSAPPAPATPGPTPSEIEFLVAQIPNQIGLIILLTAIVALLVWWRQVGFTRHSRGSLKFILLPLALTGLILATGIVTNARSGMGFLGASSTRDLLQVVLVSLMVGYTEELMFRGILFHGATARFRPLLGAIISSLVFGLFHFINLLGGQGLGWTVSQAVHAASDGFMYAAIRLITGSLWPTMLLHGLWDLAISSAHTGMQASGGQMAQSLASVQAGGIAIKPFQILPGLIYGGFVLWRWYVRQGNEAAQTKGAQL
jgi:membrane protease YdiL (CAAX protease family)